MKWADQLKYLLPACFAALGCIFSSFGQFPAHAGRIEKHSVKSEVLGAERRYSVYLPKSFDSETGRKYPVLYLFHGMGEDHNAWPDNGHVADVADLLIGSGEIAEMIIVMPDAGGNIREGAWNGYFDMPGWKYETFFFGEFMPYIESKYRVAGGKGHRAVAGLSMGGGGAAVYGQRHWDSFSSVYAMSALMDINEANRIPSRRPDDKIAILTESVQEHSCIKYVLEADEERKEELRSVKWFIDCGDDDFLLDVNLDLNRAMRAAGIPFEFRVRDGGHTWEYWRSALRTCLPFVSGNYADLILTN